MRRPALLAALLLAPVLAAAAPVAEPLKPCRLRGVEHEALCGMLKRPLDPARPQGVQIDLHYAVLPALARNKLPDPVFFFAGGPGQSAIELAGPLSAQFARTLNRRDVVLIDQRGTGRSAPLKCDEDDDAARPLAEGVDPQRMAQQLARCREGLQRKPWGDLRFYTTTIAMQDADAVRAALGVHRVNAVGASYGTRAVLEYLRLFPQQVRRAVIDGVAPPDMVMPASFAVDNQAALDAVFGACEHEPACATRHPQLRAQWRALLGSLPRRIEVVHPVTGRSESLLLTRDALMGLVRAPLYVPALAAALPPAMDAAAGGRFEMLAALGLSLQGKRAMSIAEGMHFSVVCSEDAPGLAAPQGTGSQAVARDFGDGFAQLYREVCSQWPRGEVSAAFRHLAPAPAPVLMLSGGLDPVTPPRHAERVARALGPQARQVVVPNAGHGVMALGCMTDVVYRFIDAERDADALAVDARCATAVPRPPAFVPVQPPAPSASSVDVPPMPAGARP
jgi:pimeloyl-ACP methyl ester carboxylesterase